MDDEDHFKTRPEHQGIHFDPIVDRDSLFDWLKENHPPLDAIVHLGACTDTTELDEHYLKRMNLEYSKAIWDYAAEKKIPLVYASSAATYGAGECGYDDDETLISKLKPLNPYGASKQLFDLWVLEQERKNRTPPAWSGFKFFNVYGYGERHKGSMASVALHAYDQIQKVGFVKLFKSHRAGIADGHQKRDFICVEDVVRVLHFVLQKPIQRGIFNLGTGQARTFLDFVSAVFRSIGRPEKIQFIDTPEVIRERYQYFTEAKMARLLHAGYTAPFTPVEEGIRIYMERLQRHGGCDHRD